MKYLVVIFLVGFLLLSGCCCIDYFFKPGGSGAQIIGVYDPDGEIIPDGGTTDERVQHVEGIVPNPSGDAAEEFGGNIILVHNNEEQYVTPYPIGNGSWEFSGDLVLVRGQNTLSIRVVDDNGNTVSSSSSYTINADIPVRDITVVLTWNTDETDVDLHIYAPNGQHCWYRDLDGITDAYLDIDDVDGYGPETFTQETAQNGTYIVKVRYYSTHGVESQTTASVRVTLNEQTSQTFTHTFTADQANQDDPSNDWEVYTFSVN